MNPLMGSLTDSVVQCWGCPIFDRLFGVVSAAAAAAYQQFSLFCALIFCVLMAFYILNAVWQNIKGGVTDPFYQKSIRPVIINSIVVFGLLSVGVALPRFVTTITFEPVADMTLVYTQSMIKTDSTIVNEKVTYQPMEMRDDGFFRPALRDKVINLMKTTITQFQSYIKLGIAVMDRAFSWTALTGLGALIRHFIMFVVGLYLAYNFFRLFIRFCFYFVDIIVAMTFFAFFFPLSLVMFVFKNSDAPEWMKKIGGGYGADQFKNLVNAIVTLASAVLTYTVIMVVIAKFFANGELSTTELMDLILSGQIYADALSDENLAAMTIGGCAAMVYVINYMAKQIPEVTKSVMKTFEVEENNKLSEQLADDVLNVTKNIVNTATNVAKKVVGIESKDAKDEKPAETKK